MLFCFTTPATIISNSLQKQGARMLNEHQINNQRTGGSIKDFKKKHPSHFLISLLDL
jgi:hypothetical protein